MYTNEQIQELLRNRNIKKCSSTNITYNNQFKIDSVLKYYKEGYSPTMIFKEAGLDPELIGFDKPKSCLNRWRKIYHSSGEKGLSMDTRGNKSSGRPPKPKSDAEKIKFLEAKIKYLNKENDFLAKLRGIKRRKLSNHPKSSRS
mgnify:CR=1 FL=1